MAAMAMAAIAVMDAEELSSSGKAVAEVVPKSLIPSHDFAVWILKMIRQLMDAVGLSHGGYMEEIVYTVVVLFVALAIGLLVKRGVLLVARKIVKLRHTPAGKELLAQKTLKKCSHFITPLVFLCLIPVAFSTDHGTLDWILRIVGVYTLITFGMAICAVLEFAWVRFDGKTPKTIL